MKQKFLLFFTCCFMVFLTSCKDDDSVTCLTCSNDLTMEFELCKEANGNASVNGENTETSYNVYYQNLLNEGIICY